MELRRRMFGKIGGGGGGLPAGYTQVEYIENTSNAYIDTGVYATNSTQIDLYMQRTGGASSNNYMLGCSDIVANTTSSNIAAYQSGSWMYTRLNKTNATRQSTYGLGSTYHIKKYGDTIEFDDGTTQKTFTFTDLGEYTTIGTILFLISSINRTITDSYACYGKIYGATIDNVRNFVPCISPDNVVGLYDTIGNQFYSSPNGTAFIAGNPV